MLVKLLPMACCTKFSDGRTYPSLASVSLVLKWVQRIIYGSLSYSKFRSLKAGIVGLHRQKEDPREPRDPSLLPLPRASLQVLPVGSGSQLCLLCRAKALIMFMNRRKRVTPPAPGKPYSRSLAKKRLLVSGWGEPCIPRSNCLADWLLACC